MILLGAAISALCTVALCPVVIAALRRRAVIDNPVTRSSHSAPTLRGGGIAPAIGACLGAVVATSSSSAWVLVTAVVALAFGAIGLADDLCSLSAQRRLVLQVGAAGVFGIGLATFRTPTDAGVIVAGVMAIAAALWIVSYVNAFNFMDGINGISVAQVIVAGAAWTVMGIWRDEPTVTAGGLIVAAAAVAFAPFNFPQARVFLGDVGSYFFGGWLAVMALIVVERGLTPEVAVAPLLLYLADTGTTLVRRIIRRAAWMEPHREHTYQRLLDAGWSHSQTTGFVAAVMAASGLAASVTVTGSLASRLVADLALVLLTLGYLSAPSQLRRFQTASPDPTR